MVETELVVKIASGGAGQTVRDVLGVQKAIAQLGKDAKDTNALARQLGTAFNLPSDQVEDLAKALRQAKGEAEGFDRLDALGKLTEIFDGSATAAQGFADSLGLTADEALAALAVINELNEGSVSSADQYELLNSQLGVTAEQYQRLAATAETAQGRLQNALGKGVTGEVSGLNNRFSLLLKTLLAFGGAVGVFVAVDRALKANGKSWQEVASRVGLTDERTKAFFDAFRSGVAGATTRAQAFVATLGNLAKATVISDKGGLQGILETVGRITTGLAAVKTAQAFLGQLTGQAGGAEKAVNAVGQRAGSLGDLAFQFNNILQSVQALLGPLRAVNNVIGDVVGNSLGQAIAFDDARAAAATLTSDTDALVAALGEAQGRLGDQVGTTELLASSYDILSAGFTDAGEAAAIAEAAARGALGGFSDTNTAADALTTIINAYSQLGVTADDAGAIVDQLVKTQDLGKVTLGQYADQIGRAASIAATAGVSFTEFSGAIATATARGVPAESAVSGTRQAIVNLLKPTADATKLLEEFGIKNATAALRSEGLVGILEILRDQGATTDELSKIFSDVDALATVATLAGENLETFKANIDGVANSAGAADRNVGILTQTLTGQLNALRTQQTEAFLAIGQAIQPAFEGVLGVVDQIISRSGVTGDTLAPLADSAQQLKEALLGNPQLIQQIADAMRTVAEITVNQLAKGLSTVANFLESSPGAVSELLSNLGTLAQAAFGLAQNFAELAASAGGSSIQAFQDLAPVLSVAASTLGFIVDVVRQLGVETGLLNVVLKVLVLRFLAVQAIALGQVLLGVAGAMGTLAAATKVATAVLGAFGVSATAVLGPLALLAAAVAAVKFVRFTKDLKDAQDALESYITGLDASTSQGIAFAEKLNNLNDAIAGAGGKATDEQRKKLEEYVRLSKDQVAALEQQLSEVQAFEPQNDAQRNAQANLLSQLRSTIGALNGQITEAEGTLSNAAQATGKAGGVTLGQAFQEGVEESTEAVDPRPILDEFVKANRDALDQIELDSLNAEAAILAGGGAQEKLAANEKAALNKRIEENKRFLTELKSVQAQTGFADSEGEDAAEDAAEQIKQLETQLAQDRVALARQTLEEKKRTEQAAAKAAEAAAKKTTDALKKQRDEEKRLAEEAEAEREKAAQREFDDARDGRSEARDAQRRAEDRAFQDALQSDDDAHQKQQRAEDKAAQEERQAKEEAFQKQQQAKAEAFQKQLDGKRDKANREFDALGSEVDRRVQLAEADPADRAALQEQFEQERKNLELRRQIEKEVLAQSGQVLAREDLSLSPLEQARADFEARLQEEAKAFQLTQQEEAAAFQAGLDDAEDARMLAREQLEDDRAKERRALEDERERLRREEDKEFEAEERRIQDDFEAQQRRIKGEFNNEQRRLDEESAANIARILEAAKPASIDGARRDGGPVKAGGTYLVGEEGPEIVTMRRSGYVHTARETAAMLSGTPAMRGGVSVPQAGAGMGTGKLESQMAELIKEVKRGRSVQAGGNTYNLSTPTPVQDAVSLQLEQLRAQIRSGLL